MERKNVIQMIKAELDRTDDEANRMMVDEAVQVAAIAIKFIENLYR